MSPLRPLRILIEDPALLDPPAVAGPFEVTVCGGPDAENEACPLVMEGTCPFGPFDVVVGALSGPWDRSVRAAWGASGTPHVDVTESAPDDPGERVIHHLGAAVRTLAGPGINALSRDPVAATENVDCGRLYEQRRRALVDLLRSRPAADLDSPVPATPLWTVRDVLAHVVGIAADLNAGRLGDGDPDRWTAAQVHQRRGRSLEALAREWEDEAPRFEDGLRMFGYEVGSHFVADLLQHDADVRAALGVEQHPPDDALEVGLDFYVDWLDHNLPPGTAMVLSDPRRSWRLGSGEVVAEVRAGTVELFRMLGGRRSAAQIGAMEWQGDPAAVLPYLSAYPLPDRNLS